MNPRSFRRITNKFHSFCRFLEHNYMTYSIEESSHGWVVRPLIGDNSHLLPIINGDDFLW